MENDLILGIFNEAEHQPSKVNSSLHLLLEPLVYECSHSMQKPDT
jgi:hypothetical protein